jgi:hypothetical protein
MWRLVIVSVFGLAIMTCESAVESTLGMDNCDGKMDFVRSEWGEPDSVTREYQPNGLLGGDTHVVWYYHSEQTTFTFLWGDHYRNCEGGKNKE